jgi:hypothetical protein
VDLKIILLATDNKLSDHKYIPAELSQPSEHARANLILPEMKKPRIRGAD